jgi:hypothetical protein
MYTVIGWDVGIKNLAFCSVSIKDKKTPIDQFKVNRWEIVNLTTEPEIRYCIQCQAKAKYTIGDAYFCGRHGDRSARVEIPKPKKLVKDLVVFGRRLNEELNSRKDTMLQADMVVIENQPSLQNPFMKSIQIILFSWFLFNGVEVMMMSANNKLKVYEGPVIDMSHIKNAYNRRKKTGIAQCRAILQDDQSSIQILDKNKSKCDDLCDAYLMACYQIFRYQDKVKKRKKKKK